MDELNKNKTREWVANLLTAFAGQGNTLTIPRPYIDLTGSLEAALLLSQVVYWTDRATMDEGWFAKTYAEWEAELTLSKYQVMKAMKVLAEAGVETVVKKFDGSPTVHYRLNKVTFSQWIVEKLNYPTLKNLTNDGEKTSRSSTEPTAEPTAEIERLSPPVEVAADAIVKNEVSTEVIQGIPVKPLYIIQGMPVDDNPLPPDVQFFKHTETGVTYEFPRNQWGESVPMKNPSIPTGDKLNTLMLDLAAASFFGMAYPPAANRWSYLKLMTNFFTGRIEADAKKKKQSEWYEYQFTDDPFTADEIMAMLFWWEDATTDDMKLQKPSTIAEKVVLFRLSENYEDYLKNARYAIETRLNELYPPIMPVKTLASPEEIAAVFDFTPRR